MLQANYDTHDSVSVPELLITKSIICEILKDSVIDSDVEVANAASRVLFKTLSSKEGYKVVRGSSSVYRLSIIIGEMTGSCSLNDGLNFLCS